MENPASRPSQPICLALTGASGQIYGLRLLECLLNAGEKVQLLYSEAARIVLLQELGLDLSANPGDAKTRLLARYPGLSGSLEVYERQDWFAPMASGSNPPKAMVICPCSMGTLAAISQGMSGNLIERAADVLLKERKKLLLAVRETPLSAIHLENMLRLTHAGAVIMPLAPGFYHRPQTIAGLVDFMAARALDQLGIAHALTGRWGSPLAQPA